MDCIGNDMPARSDFYKSFENLFFVVYEYCVDFAPTCK